MTILLYCRRKKWELLGISVTCILDETDESILAKNEEAQSSIGNISVSIKLDSNLMNIKYQESKAYLLDVLSTKSSVTAMQSVITLKPNRELIKSIKCT